ncbi:MAG: AtpZ/AtpI family protein [Candidatus Falkowbacteria bacterium]|nr:AtpZ/AtpI family protein [Candidatus Falkowbacteria bacterium]
MANISKPNNNWSTALKIFIKLSAWVGFPVIIGAFLGRWLDRKYGTEPWLFLGTLGFCFLISMYGLIINAVREFKKIELEATNKKVTIKTPADWDREDKEKEAKFKNNNYSDNNQD